MSFVECNTADDVRQAVKRVTQFRKTLAPPSWADQRRFASLVQSAYPTSYPRQPSFEELVASAYPEYYPGPRAHTCRGILKAISWKFDVPVDTLLSARRQANIVHARHIGWGLCRHLTSYSFPEIAMVWRRDHTTILHGCGKVQPIIDEVAKRIPLEAPTEYWVKEAYSVSDDFPQLYPFANCGNAVTLHKARAAWIARTRAA